jgi:fibronectin type 3 domain-containing protein
VLTIPSSVLGLFSKEEGTTAHLKWSANPEKGIRGYRVYRMDGRYDKEPVTRLTPDPIRERTFSDPGAGKKSRRYYVVAVDALGQEGYPSSPVWHEREWKPFYVPFTAEWHQ